MIGLPRSIVAVGPDEALRRERRASQLPEVKSLVRELVRSGYKRTGAPKGVDGVSGYITAGAHVVSLGFAKVGSDKVTAVVEARTWDQRRESQPCEEVMPDVYSREMIPGASGTPAVARFRYVDEGGSLATREQVLDVGSMEAVCGEPDCHTHPPGTCPAGCTAACVHCSYYANVCTGSPPDCSACVACSACPHWACSISCALVCEAVCSTLTESWCCDPTDSVCCPPDYSVFPPRFECL